MPEYHGAYWEKWYVFNYRGGREYRIWPGTGVYWDPDY